ncbi:unnamed protein product [Closterium sp. Naga37s-1]|nr:unnamed protein product [Closterium sp. Naga37s-1]
MAPMTSILTKLKYYRERAQVLAFICQHYFYSRNPRGELPLYNWMKFIALGMKEKRVHVGDVLCVSLEGPTTATTAAASRGQVTPRAATSLYSHTQFLNAHAPAELPARGRSITVHVGDVLCVGLEAPTATTVAAVAGDEIVSSQPSDEPIRIEDNHFWVLADNPDVPAQEAWDSRTFGPVHLEDVLGRTMYVVRSMHDHGPIKNSPQAMEEDATVMAGEGDLESVLHRVRVQMR